MFEKLAGNVLSKVLSKYFTEDSLSRNNSKGTKSAQLGVWSGYISLQNLEVKVDVINSLLRQKGEPFELVHCSLRQIEITIPWAKLSNPIGSSRSNSSTSSSSSSSSNPSSSNSKSNKNTDRDWGSKSNKSQPSLSKGGRTSSGSDGSNQDAVAVLILDGVHVLFRTNFTFYDDELRQQEIKKRRKALCQSESFAKGESAVGLDGNSSESQSYTEMIKKRITSGILQEIVDKLHVHIRDLHIRVEDTESDPASPFAFGVTMESMHVQHDDSEGDSDGRTQWERSSTPGVVSKVAQINHFAAYWNALEYGSGMPVENSILYMTCEGGIEKLSRALDRCIARRGSLLASPSKIQYSPTHTYVLLPVDGELHILLSTTPKDLSSRPAMEVVIQFDIVSTNLRDFQCVQMLTLYGERKNFNFVKRYRKFRPKGSVMDNPKDWWKYAARVIKYQLQEHFFRWSWSRFETTYATRLRYMDLHERRMRLSSEYGDIINADVVNNDSSGDSLQEQSRRIGDGETVAVLNRMDGKDPLRLSPSERDELRSLEDGIHGDLSVSDIILFRAVVNMRLGVRSRTVTNGNNSQNNSSSWATTGSSWWRQTVQDATVDDSEARQEFDRLLQHLEGASDDDVFPDGRNKALMAVTVMIHLEEVHCALFSPLHATSDETQLRRLHEKFLEFKTMGTRMGGSLRGDYKNWDCEFSVQDFLASEIRHDKSQYIIANHINKEEGHNTGESHGRTNTDDDNDDDNHERPMLYFTYAKNPVSNPDVSKEVRLFFDAIEMRMNPDCQWLAHLKEFMKQVTTVPNVSKFWGELSFAYINSLALGRLGLVAKAESAASDHENIDIDITMICPVIRVGMGDGGDLIVNLGVLSLKTDKLSGISRNNQKNLPLMQDPDTEDEENVFTPERWRNSVDGGSVTGSRSFRNSMSRKGSARLAFRRPMQKFIFSSAMSVESMRGGEQGDRSFSGSLNLEDDFPQVEATTDKRKQEDETLQALFYDRYQLRLQTGKLTFSGESEVFDISSGFELRTSIQKSVIPSDHTMCKIKAHCVVGQVHIILNEDILYRLRMAFITWKQMVVVDVGSQSFQSVQTVSKPRFDMLATLPSRSMDSSLDENWRELGSGSEIDEDEFFDANEATESVGGGNSGIWFEDNWIADAESVMDGESRSSLSDHRRGRRRTPSISDVSSVSDHSKSRTNQQENGYLSAENLARLEEGVGEDESVAETRQEKDEDSFHSVMSNKGQAQLLGDIQVDIRQSEERIEELFAELTNTGSQRIDASESELLERRRRRKGVKLELDRAKAELKALRAVNNDLSSMMSDRSILHLGKADDNPLSAIVVQQANRAKELLRAKRHRDRTSSTGHNLVQDLNRELFKGSFQINKIQIDFQTVGSLDISESDPSVKVEFVASQTGVAVLHQANEAKVYFSLDQVTASVSSDSPLSNQSLRVLFAGGSNDPVLPVHLPHLVAQSMEDRFVRGAIILGKQRSVDFANQVAKFAKVRLVVGDVEISPYTKCIVPIVRCLQIMKGADAESDAIPESPSLVTVAKKSNITRSPRCYDLAIRLTSIRVALSQEDDIIGAIAFSETSLRFLHKSSDTRNRTQIDFRCSNMQLLDIVNLESGRGSEIIGRRDPYSSLIQFRIRSQSVPADEKGGWVVGVGRRSSDTMRRQAFCNVHLGVRINPLSLIASPEAVSKFIRSSDELRQVLSFRRKDRAIEKKQKRLTHDWLPGNYPVRWRVDVAFRRIIINVPEDSKVDWNVTEDAGSKILIAVSLVLSIQESPSSKGSLSVRMGLTDISLIRSSDDWPILEPFSVIFEFILRSESLLGLLPNSMEEDSQLNLPLDSKLNEIDGVMARYGWDSIPSRKTEGPTSRLVLKISPLKINISASVIILLADIAKAAQAVKLAQKYHREGESKSSQNSDLLLEPTNIEGKVQFGLHVFMEDMELQLLQESELKPLAQATPLVSFTLTDVTIDFNQLDQITASVLIRDSSLFDLSSGRGVRVVGEDPEARLDFPYFVRVKLYMEQHLDGPQTIRLQINWGKIQCLIMPSFFRSLVSLKDGLSQLGRSNAPSGPKSPLKQDLLSRFLGHPNDINLILSADAETFECILSSRDIVEYVKSGDRHPCGVVSLRWRASLCVALALDCLRQSSMPWLTLNIDGAFTDDDDANIFKDFSHRYLDRNSGFLTGNDETGQEIVNAFTIRISHRLSNFQALRTNISRLDLENSSRRSFASLPRLCFRISQPAAGEQRITNPIDCMFLYRAAGASMNKTQNPRPRAYQVEMAQLLQLEANYVDVLLYSQSTNSGGFTDAFRVSIKPILELFKRKESRRLIDDSDGQEAISESRSHSRSPSFLDLVKSSPSVCTIQIDGLKVTFVPGGSSRLNESPIIKFELADVHSGVAAAPVPQDLKFIAGSSPSHGNGSPRQYISGSEVMNITVGGWVACQITAHYHNRRLVEWEPFIEPWSSSARFGIDTVEVLKWKPVVKEESKISRTSNHMSPAVVKAPQGEAENFGKGDRLRDIGRLFRSPFQSLQSSSSTRKGPFFLTHSDFCFLMLSSTARKTVTSALCPSSDSQTEKESKVFSTMPSQGPLEWLEGFGQPTKTRGEGPFAVSFLLSDAQPLNINLTGALIDNVMGYLNNSDRVELKAVVPHLIRNETGMTIRFQEALEADRSKKGEQTAKIILPNESEAPLTLKRALSQTCDPHRAYIYLELGSFEDTVGRVNQEDFEIPKGQRSSSFFFKAAAKIPVDAVGVHRYPLDRNIDNRADMKPLGSNSRALGWIIVRVALRGNVKVVSVESPFVLKSAADADLLCEVRDQSGLSLLWRCLVPKEAGSESRWKQTGIVSVPADIVPFIHDGSYRFSVAALSRESSSSHEAEVISVSDHAVEIATPPPFSPNSFAKGLIGEEEIVLPSLMVPRSNSDGAIIVDYSEMIHLTICSARIGSVNFAGVNASVEVPEQRMIFFRSPLVIRNFLALPIDVQVRVKSNSASTSNATSGTRRDSLMRGSSVLTDWEDLGVLDCGESVNWTGSLASDRVQIRARFVGTDGDNSRRFPGWSSAVNIPARSKSYRKPLNSDSAKTFAKMKLFDADNVALFLSVALEQGNGNVEGEHSEDEDIRQFCRSFPSASRVVSIFVPYWIVDETHQDLEFFAGHPVAGQLDSTARRDDKDMEKHNFGHTLGLAELMDNSSFLQNARSEFEVLMIGEGSSSRLTVRKRLARKGRLVVLRNASPWSEPIPLQGGQKARHDLSVLTPKDVSGSEDFNIDDPRGFDRLVLRSSIVNASTRFGGHLGTKLIHIVNRYSISNETGRDIEIVPGTGIGSHLLVRATTRPEPFHFDDSRPIRFRFKEFGWTWSGLFSVRSNRREVTMRLRHKMKGQTVIVTVEVRATKKSATNLLVFRQSNYPPFRLENHTMFPLHFGQALARLGTEENDVDSLLLQYQNADFAWDEPEVRRRALLVRYSGASGTFDDVTLGRFYLDKLAPGTDLKLGNDMFSAEVVADGPTRVLRISDASMPRISSFRQDEFDYFHHSPEVSKPLTLSIVAKISHGIGISVIDFSPQELLYIRLDDVQIENSIDGKKDKVHISIGNIKFNNQLWVTPYPVLLKMGRQYDSNSARRRNRKHDALTIAWSSSLNTHGGYGNLTLLDKIEVSSEPMMVNVDGEVAELLVRMVRHVGGIGSDGVDVVPAASRDLELKNVLSINEVGEDTSERSTKNTGNSPPDEFAGDFLTTAAVAAKLKSRQDYQQLTTPRRHTYLPGRHAPTAKKRKPEPRSKVGHKFYIEKLKVSATKADLSWSGPLPGVLSSLLFRALTFERLPIRLRPFSSSHVYGNLSDHLENLQSHYVSIWRIFDLVLGLSSNPTFLFRAILFTFRESCASILGRWAASLERSSTEIVKLLPRNSDFKPTYEDDVVNSLWPPNGLNHAQRSLVYMWTFAPIFNSTILMFQNLSIAARWMSMQIHYGERSSNATTRGFLRSRNPRLFAHLDGKDLLVEYVEGENAGKALLSRVRMGLHLGEGYFFHAEGARIRKPLARSRTELDPFPFIVMITSERVLLLTGKLDGNFCSVMWESYFMNIIHVDLIASDELSTFGFDEIVLWHLSDPKFSEGNLEKTRDERYASSVIVSGVGVDVLRSKSIYVPRLIGQQVMGKMHSVDGRL